jgi:hypothetical protein
VAFFIDVSIFDQTSQNKEELSSSLKKEKKAYVYYQTQ